LPGGPAQKAGIAVGDVILRYDSNTPTDERALLRDIARTQVGATITLSVLRDGHELAVPVTADAWPRDQWDTRDAPTPVLRPKIPNPPDLGLAFATLDAAAKAKLMGGNDVTGVLVKSVAPSSDPALRGMVSGDVILRVLDKAVATPDDVLSGIKAARASKREFVLMLVLPKVRDVPGPKWVALRLNSASE
jgi:serine protease Do